MPKPLDRFRLSDALETHGDIVLYRATEDLPGQASRTVLLKVFPPLAAKEKNIEARFHAQVKIMAQLTSSAYTLSLYSAGITENQPWIAMELLPNTVSSLHAERPGDAPTIEKLLRQIAQPLLAMHALTPPVLHNAVVPANIHIDSLNNFRLGGFDSSGPATSEMAYTASAIQYSAPEMLSSDQGRAGPPADLYALGHVAYELALGTRLFRQQFPAVFDPKDPRQEASSAKWMAWHYSMGAKVPPVAELVKEFPQALSDIIAKLIAKPLADRLPTASALLAELDRAGSFARAAAISAPAAAASSSAAVSSNSAAGIPAPTTARPTPVPAPARSFSRSVASPAAPADPNAVKYYLRLRGRMTGPFDMPTLQRHVKQGAISRLHEASTDRQNWRPATTIEGLFGGATPPAE